MPPPPAWEQCCLNNIESLPDSTLLLTSPGSFPQRSRPMILEIGSCSSLNWCWRNEALAGGSSIPLTVATDQKNVEFLRSAKRLNRRQARWALFFTLSQFSIMYRPGDKNVKADSLSRIHAPDEPSSPESILPPAVLVSPIR